MSRIPILAFPEESDLAVSHVRTHPVVRYVKVLSRTTLLATIVVFCVFKYVIQPATETTLKRRFELQNWAFVKLKQLSSRLKKTVRNPPGIKVTYNKKIMVDRIICTDDIKIEELKQSEFELFKRESKKKTYSHGSPLGVGADNSGKKVKFQNIEGETQSDLTTYTELNERVNYSSSKLITSLKNLRDRMKDFEVSEYRQLTHSTPYNMGDPEMNSLLYQVKQLKNYLEVMTSEHPREMLFKKPVSHIQIGKDSRSCRFNYIDIIDDNLNELKSIVDKRF